MDEKTILVTGAAGFIGAAFCRRLLEEKDACVIGADDLNEYYDVRLKQSRLDELSASDGFRFERADIADAGKVNDLFRKYQPEIVVNLAAQAGVRYSIDHPESYVKSNVAGFFNILEACRHASQNGNPVEHLVYASSSSVYGENAKVPFSTEDKTDEPVSFYAATKKSNELFAYSYAKLYGIPMTGLRFFTVYGPKGRPDMAYYKFAEKLCAGESIRIYNYGNSLRDFTYIDDITEGLMRILQKAPENAVPHRVYNIGNSDPVKLLDFVDILQEELQRAGLLPEDYDASAHREMVPMQKGDVPVTYADVRALEEEFGFRPRTDLRRGLREFVSWYKEYKTMQ